MILDKISGFIEHRKFYEICDFFKQGDLLVVNDSKVLPARLYGVKEDTGCEIEFLLVEQKKEKQWEVLVKPGRRLKQGTRVTFHNGILKAEISEVLPNHNRLVNFSYEGNFFNLLEQIGKMPLPHYIKETLSDQNCYQTVYAKEPGSCAAPTAGLHFTEELMNQLKKKGVKFASVTLHVGVGTFRPVKVDDITQHTMHSEHFYLPAETAEAINRTKKSGGKIYAVGTTSCRTLESVAQRNGGQVLESEGYTDIFIYPGFEFKIIDGMITNFHLPESTLIMLVSALAGRENILNAYQVAINEGYRFYSFGDAMLIK